VRQGRVRLRTARFSSQVRPSGVRSECPPGRKRTL
jgi:hypothetical protein